MDSSVSAHVQAIPSKSHSDNGPEIWCITMHILIPHSVNQLVHYTIQLSSMTLKYVYQLHVAMFQGSCCMRQKVGRSLRAGGFQGFIQRERGGGGLESLPPLPPRNLEIEYGYYYISCLHVTEHMCHQNVVWKFCPRLRQKQSERL